MKKSIRKSALGVIASALVITSFVGCTSTPSESTNASITADIAETTTDNRDITTDDHSIADDSSAEPTDSDLNSETTTKPVEDKPIEETSATTIEETMPAEETDTPQPAQTTTQQPAQTTTEAELAEPVTSVPGVDNSGKDKKFTGDKSTALITELPAGCYWSPTPKYPNAYTDAAGNLWCNNKAPETTGAWLTECGYYDPSGRYHATQEEIDHAAALNAAIHDNHENGPKYSNDDMTEQDGEDLADLFGF
ncbi:MAG: hypothetical protein ACI4KM_03110 [Oscillospiraceae bacterium]